MCEICDGAKSTSEMPCSKVLTEFGKILYQVVGGGPAAQMAMQTAGGLHSPSEKGREVYGNLLYGIHLGRAEEIRTERKQHRRDRWFAVEFQKKNKNCSRRWSFGVTEGLLRSHRLIAGNDSVPSSGIARA